MKVTAIIDDQIIQEAVKYSKARSITEALKVALRVYISSEKLKVLGKKVKKDPLQFRHSAAELRKTNRGL